MTWIFRLCRKTLISNFMTSSTGKQISTKQILSNASRSKCNQLHFVSCENITWEIFFFKSRAKYEAGRLVPNLFVFFFFLTLYEVKASGQHLSFNVLIIFDLNIANCVKFQTVDPEINPILIFLEIFDFFFRDDFSRKIFLLLYFTNYFIN